MEQNTKQPITNTRILMQMLVQTIPQILFVLRGFARIFIIIYLFWMVGHIVVHTKLIETMPYVLGSKFAKSACFVDPNNIACQFVISFSFLFIEIPIIIFLILCAIIVIAVVCGIIYGITSSIYLWSTNQYNSAKMALEKQETKTE